LIQILYQSHLYKIRVKEPAELDPWLLFAALNSPIVKRQIRSKCFTQDIIDTLGNRLGEVRIPLPRDADLAARVSREIEGAVQMRAKLREQTRRPAIDAEGEPAEEDLSSLEEAD
jgi:type I restriction enzyme M protein